MTFYDNNLVWQLFLVVSVSLLSNTGVLAQSCNSAIEPTTPNSRFQAKNDGTVTDLQTKLMWKKCAEGQSGAKCKSGDAEDFYWDAGLQHADNLNGVGGGFAGYVDWRVPNRKELESILEEACHKPAVNLDIFPNTPNDFFWSSSHYPTSVTYAWGVDFGSGVSFPSFSTQRPIRLVRDAQ